MLSVAAVVVVLALASSSSAINVVPHVNTTAYLGRWYQVYSDAIVSSWFERGGVCTTADYGLNGANNISVYNSQLQNGPTGEHRVITGYAFRPNPSIEGKLEVHFDFHVDGEYWIVDLGPQNYTGLAVCNPCYDYAVVTDSLQVSLFVLTRDVSKFAKVYEQQVLADLKAQGFTKEYNTPKATFQSPQCQYPPIPSF